MTVMFPLYVKYNFIYIWLQDKLSGFYRAALPEGTMPNECVQLRKIVTATSTRWKLFALFFNAKHEKFTKLCPCFVHIDGIAKCFKTAPPPQKKAPKSLLLLFSYGNWTLQSLKNSS